MHEDRLNLFAAPRWQDVRRSVEYGDPVQVRTEKVKKYSYPRNCQLLRHR